MQMMFDPRERLVFLRLVAPSTLTGMDISTTDRLKQIANTPVQERLIGIWRAVQTIWPDAEMSIAFLFHGHPALGGRRPVDVALEEDARR
jgi:uncharacterized protein (DUF2384 family)